MKITYTDLLGQSREIIDKQSDAVKKTIDRVDSYNDDSVKKLAKFLEKKETKYKTYTHC